jgi:hypothetical protein
LRAWDDLKAALVTNYGPANAATMVRAIVSDAPLTSCRLSGDAARATATPVADPAAERVVDVTLVNQTGAVLSCTDAVLDGGAWTNLPADQVGIGGSAQWQAHTPTDVGHIEGSARYRIEGSRSDVTLVWHDPSIGSGDPSCDAGPGFVCTWTDGAEDHGAVTFTVAPA